MKFHLSPLIIAFAVASCLPQGASAGSGTDLDPMINGLRWGDGVPQIRAAFPGVEPDLCSAADQSWYAANKWSCEGFIQPRFVVLGIEFNARLRMSDDFYGLANVNFRATIPRGSSDHSRRARIVRACQAIADEFVVRYGPSDPASAIDTPSAYRRTVFWHSSASASSVTLACTDSSDGAEVMVDYTPEHHRQARL